MAKVKAHTRRVRGKVIKVKGHTRHHTGSRKRSRRHGRKHHRSAHKRVMKSKSFRSKMSHMMKRVHRKAGNRR